MPAPDAASAGARSATRWASLVRETAQRYAPCGIRQREFVRGKLRFDPLYSALLGLLEDAPRAVIADLGCGRGIALALLDTARRYSGIATDLQGALEGVDRSARCVDVARTALAGSARIRQGTLEEWVPERADVLLLLDVLHYMPAAEQGRLVARAAQAVAVGGHLLLREPNRGSGARFRVTCAAERLRALGRGAWRQRFHYRSGVEWVALLEAHGFTVRAMPSSSGTPFDNLLLDAQRAARAPSSVKVDASITPGSTSRISTTSGLA